MNYSGQKLKKDESLVEFQNTISDKQTTNTHKYECIHRKKLLSEKKEKEIFGDSDFLIPEFKFIGSKIRLIRM